MAAEDKGLVSCIGPIEIDWPRSIGFFGALGAATVVGLIEPPLGLFIAAVPFIKMLNRPQLPTPSRFVSQILDGMAKPVGGDAEGTIRYAKQEDGSPTSTSAAARAPTSSQKPTARRDSGPSQKRGAPRASGRR
jgi:hypothetical protein